MLCIDEFIVSCNWGENSTLYWLGST